MKTIEQIKQEYTAATGKTLPIFTFKGELGILMEVMNPKSHAWGTDFVPFSKLNTDNIDYDCIHGLTSESDYAEEGEEITDQPIVNDENEQRLIVDCVFSTVNYWKSDMYCRQLLVTTTRFYDWTSDRRRMIDMIHESIKNDRFEEQKNELEKEWNEMVSQYSDPCGTAEFQPNSIEFDSLVEEAQ